MTNPQKWPFLIMAVLLLGACKEPEATTPLERPAVAADPVNVTQVEATPGVLRRLEGTQAAAELKPAAWCNLEAFGNLAFEGEDIQVDSGATKVSGWIADEATRTLPNTPSLRVESVSDKTAVWDTPLRLGNKRDDVASAMSVPAIAEAGFAQEFVMEGLSPGRYHLYLVYISRDGVTACDNGRHIYVRR